MRFWSTGFSARQYHISKCSEINAIPGRVGLNSLVGNKALLKVLNKGLSGYREGKGRE